MIVNIENINNGYLEIPNNWKTTENKYNTLDSSVHFADGFRTVVEPIIDEATQYKGVIFYDEINDVVTYNVITYTQAEIDANLVSKEEKEDKSDLEILERKGGNLYEKTKKRLIRRNKKGLITKTRCKKVREYLHPIFLLLRTGDIDIANDLALTLTVDANADINAELVWFKAEIAQLKLDVNNLL